MIMRDGELSALHVACAVKRMQTLLPPTSHCHSMCSTHVPVLLPGLVPATMDSFILSLVCSALLPKIFLPPFCCSQSML